MTDEKIAHIESQIEALLDKQAICNEKCHKFSDLARVENDANKRQRLQRLSDFYNRKSSGYRHLSVALKMFL